MSTAFYDDQYMRMDDHVWQWRELGGAAKARNIVSIVRDLPISSVVDVGCGTGTVLAHLSRLRLGQAYYALDISNRAISFVNSRGDITGLVASRTFDGAHLPYNDQQFDLAVLSHVIEHLIDPIPLLREAARVARYLAVEVPLEDNLYTHLKVRLLRSRYREELGHVQWFNRHNFRSLLECSCGLEVVSMNVVYLPDELYFFRKRSSRGLVSVSLALRKALRALSDDLYTCLLTDHCIALVRAS